MMHASSRRQKQKLTLIKSQRLASSAYLHTATLPFLKRNRYKLLAFGIITGLGFPVLALAAQQSSTHRSPSSASHGSTRVNIETKSPQSSPNKREDFLNQENDSWQSSAQSREHTDTSVTINGEEVPLENGSVSRHFSDGKGGHTDVQVNVDNSSVSSSVSSRSSSSSAEIRTESHSSTSTSTQSKIRGSPRQ